MPYEVKRSGNKWVVKNKTTGAIKGEHPSLQDARRHMRALYANTKEEGKKRRSKRK